MSKPADSTRPILQPTLRTDSEHEQVLMRFFAMHRIATPYNIVHALPIHFTYHNKAMRHLNWLANNGYLRRHPYNDGYVYNITDAGYERCRDKDINLDLNLIPYKYTEPTGKQVEHELLITKSAISLYQCVRGQQRFGLLHEGRFGLQNIVVTDEETGEALRPFEHLIPDYVYLSRDANGLMFRMLEAVRGVESTDNVRTTIVEYERWGRTRAAQQFLLQLYRHHGAGSPRPEFEVHCILESSSWKHTDDWKERMTMMQTYYVEPQMQGRVWTTTKDAIEEALAEGKSINHNIWHRGRDLLGERRERWERAGNGNRTRLIDGFMRTIPTHPLFA